MQAEPGLASAPLPSGSPSAPVPPAEKERPTVVWALAWPVILALLSESLVGLVDMLMVLFHFRSGPHARRLAPPQPQTADLRAQPSA